jgi:hypothetical protein
MNRVSNGLTAAAVTRGMEEKTGKHTPFSFGWPGKKHGYTSSYVLIPIPK